MLISRHLVFIDMLVGCWRQELCFDPPLEIDLSLGKISSILNSHMPPKGTSSGSLRKCKPVVNANHILHVNEVMKTGESLSVGIRPGFRLNNITLDPSHSLQILANDYGLVFWFSIGRDGVFEITGEMVKDDDRYFTKLKSNLKDIPFRAYIVQRSLADSKVTMAEIAKPPDLMDTKTAAKYLGVSTSKVYKLAESGVIPRTPNKRYRRVDLDTYLAGGLDQKKRSSR